MIDDTRPDASQWRLVASALLASDQRPRLLLDVHRRILDANAPFEELVGRVKSELIGRTLGELSPAGQSSEGLSRAVGHALEGGTAVSECVMATGQERRLTIVLSFERVDGTPILAAAVTRWSASTSDSVPLGATEIEIALEPFGKILRTRQQPPAGVRVGDRCFEALHGLPSPCAGCPAQPAPPPGEVRETVMYVPSKGCLIVSAVRVSEDVVRLNAKRVDDDLCSKIATAKLAEHGARAALTAREQQVLELIALGRAPLEISRELGISLSTAKFHAHNVLRKVGAESRADLVRALFLAASSHPALPSASNAPRGGRGRSRRAT